MMPFIFRTGHWLCILTVYIAGQMANAQVINLSESGYRIYPDVNDERPDLPSPFVDTENEEYVLDVTKDGKYAIMNVTLSDDRDICRQLVVNDADFPTLAKRGIHSKEELAQTTTITGRSLSEINDLARPRGLSYDGFLAEDEDILAVISGDNQRVKIMDLTHPQMAN